MFLASKGWLPLLARGTRYWLLIGHSSDILASDWSDVSMYSDACQTCRLLSVMYRPLRRHTYHSVTNNTNNQETILISHWSNSAHTAFPLAKTFTSHREVKQKVNKPSQLGLAAFFLPFFLMLHLICYLEVRFHCWAGQRRICWRWSPRGRRTFWGRGGRRERRGWDAGANSDTGVLSEASQSLLITWNKVGKICTKF